ncbi:ABC transporter permease [Haloechinothrix sp. LS1_15]|uniref:ABC transporter permease n=1 Tax=Haloechinothrix sp. LS1_15 TaxID=2652248 RepID=UPI0029462308|nr:ABC transporter permease [Haloechinothrix sp. LS1_15]MDV6010956.1 ABC transporter permease [Haloechinothrix sp. LS1_15]
MNLTYVLADGSIAAKRNFIKIKRVPEVLIWVLLSPIMFLLLFAFVFGNAIPIEGMDYREFLIAGIFAQSIVFGAMNTGTGIAEDMQKGIIDRFRSLPMSNSAVLIGRTLSDMVYNGLSLAVMALTGLLIGWQIHSSPIDAVAGFALILLFAYAVSWVFALIGLLAPSPEVVNNGSFMVVMPLTFISNVFIPIETLPTPLRVFAEWNPVSGVTQAARNLFGNTSPHAPGSDAWPMQHAELYTLIWVAILLVVFVPLAVARYQRAASR